MRFVYPGMTAAMALLLIACAKEQAPQPPQPLPRVSQRTKKAVPVPVATGFETPCTTIDATLNDDALNCVRALKQNPITHDNIATSAGNLADCTKTEQTKGLAVTVVGHGMPGFIVTGGGESFADPKAYVGYPDTDDQFWQPSYQRLDTASGKSGVVTLLACDTGAGDFGARLLFKMAHFLGRPVRARTGLVACDANGISFENGSQWQSGDPADIVPRATINVPVRPKRPKTHRIVLGNLVLSDEQVSSGSVALERAEKVWHPLNALAARNLIEDAEFDQPDPLLTVLGIPTARLRLVITGLGTREFLIYNDRLIQDVTVPQNFYYTRPEFANALAEALH